MIFFVDNDKYFYLPIDYEKMEDKKSISCYSFVEKYLMQISTIIIMKLLLTYTELSSINEDEKTQ